MNFLKTLLKILLLIILLPLKLVLRLIIKIVIAIHNHNKEVIEKEINELKRGYTWLHFLIMLAIVVIGLGSVILAFVADVSSMDFESQSSYSQRLLAGRNLQFPTSDFLKSIKDSEGKWSIFPAISGHSLQQIQKLRYAWDISKDKDFVLTFKSENGTIDPNRRSDIIGSNGYYDYGLCQLNYQWHSEFINSPDFKDWKKQMDYCYKIYLQRKGAFYGYYNRHKVEHFFTFK